jgi:O-acetyl-ADP-ribose deacetylase (regulator of RNase III)
MNQVIKEYNFPSGQKLQIIQGDLTQERVDAIVNAANAQLQHGGGVAGAISRRGGPSIQAESNAWVREHGPVSHSEPAYTRTGSLHSRYVIHAVGPVWGSGDEDAKLTAAIRGSLKTAEQLELKSIALPAISTGIFGFPTARAAKIFLAAIEDYFSKNPDSCVELVRLTLYDRQTLDVFLQEWKKRHGE